MDECVVKYAFDVLNGKWKLHILWELANQEVIRFNELRRRLNGISNLMLSKSLQELEMDGVVSRKQYNEIPPRVEYSMTEQGKELKPILDLMEEWGKSIKQSRIEREVY